MWCQLLHHHSLNIVSHFSLWCGWCQSLSPSQDEGKIKHHHKDVVEFWQHWECHEPVQHPAGAEKQHLPVGIAGDDAKYTLSGFKLIVMLLNFPLQEVMRTLVYLKLFLLCVISVLKFCNSSDLWVSYIQGLDLSRFVFFTLRYELSLGPETLDPILRVVAWSLNVSSHNINSVFWFCLTISQILTPINLYT